MTDIFVDTTISDNSGAFLYIYDSDEIILLHFDCAICQADNNGGNMYFGLQNTNDVYLTNYASTNSLATNYGALIYAFRLDTRSKTVPDLSIINVAIPGTNTGTYSLKLFTWLSLHNIISINN